MIKHLLTAVLLAAPCVTIADPFDEAVEAWLQLDDATALPALSALAKGGHEDAMLLLGMIDQAWPRSDWLQGLDRATAKDIMRAPGGLSGKNWLTQVRGQKDVAEALRYTGPDDDFAAKATTLLKADEWAGAISHLLTAFNQDTSSLVAISEATSFPAGLNHLLWFSAGFASNPAYFLANGIREETPAERALLDQPLSPEWVGSYQSRLYLSLLPNSDLPLSEQRINLALRVGEARAAGYELLGAGATDAERTEAFDAAAKLLMEAAELGPLRVLCDQTCDNVSDCTRTLYSEIDGSDGLISLHTPLSNLIPAERYWASPRFLDDLRRRARPGEQQLPAYAACAKALLHP
jgi:hypothetical protein